MRIFKTSIFCFLLLLFICFGTLSVVSEAASYKFKYKDITNDTTVKYDGKTPSFIVDGILIDNSEYPAIITDGVSMVSTRLFEEGIGVQYKYDKKAGTMTFEYADNILILNLGSKSATLNGKKKTATLPPIRIKYSATKEYANLVPARFVAESLGMIYTWHQDTTSVDIVTPVPLLINEEYKYYNGTFGKLKFSGKTVKNTKTPSYIFEDNAMLCLKTIAEAIDGFRYEFDSESDDLMITYGNISIEMKLNRTATFVNGEYKVAPVAPVKILNTRTGIERVYIPGRYVFETLGFKYEWKTDTSNITLSDNTGEYIPDYDFALFYDAETDVPDEEADNTVAEFGTETVFHQVFTLPLLEGIQVDKLNIQDFICDNLITFTLPGNYIQYYVDNKPVNTGEAVLQLQILYFEEEDITKINICTRTNSDGVILSYKLNTYPDHLEFTFDRAGCLFEKIIVLDAGHGGSQPGADYSNYKEKNMNLEIVNTYCRSYFDNSGIKVFYTRIDDRDIPLHTRPTIPARVDADLFISVHHNANSNKKAKGTSVYYANTNTNDFNGLTGKIMAQLLAADLSDRLGTKNLGAIDNPFAVTGDENTVPAVLIEVGFMSNPDELKEMVTKTFQKRVAKGIYSVVKKIYKEYGD